MALRANFQKSYLWRYLLVAVSCLAFSAWFAYDGFVGYPLKVEMAREYETLAKTLEADELKSAWRKKVAEKNWPQVTPADKADHIEQDIPQQYFWCLLTAFIGFPALYYYLTSRTQWVERTEHGLTTSWGQTVNFRDVKKIDKSKWAKKGIAKATYNENGKDRVFVFDDFKFEREKLGEMLFDLEHLLTDDQIVGGPRETKKPEEVEEEDD
ncbi:MAG: hypothetical protein ABL888_19115 [Pirellulaceae bacterium]